MKVKTGYDPVKRQNIEEWRDVLMPGIGDYRIKAARSGEYGGKTEPEFGPVVRERLGGTEVSYPQWCRITVHRIVQGEPRAFSAKEYWLENYANDGHSDKPNYMWKKRAFGQLAKCTEAQALRMAFPEFSGSQPTAEEMEGKEGFAGQTIDYEEPEVRRERHAPSTGSGGADRNTVAAKAGVTYPPRQAAEPSPPEPSWLDPLEEKNPGRWFLNFCDLVDEARTEAQMLDIGAHYTVENATKHAPPETRRKVREKLVDGMTRVKTSEADWGESPDSPPWEQEPNESDESGS